MSVFTNLLVVAIVFWGFIAAYLSMITIRLQRTEKELSILRAEIGKDKSSVD